MKAAAPNNRGKVTVCCTSFVDALCIVSRRFLVPARRSGHRLYDTPPYPPKVAILVNERFMAAGHKEGHHWDKSIELFFLTCKGLSIDDVGS